MNRRTSYGTVAGELISESWIVQIRTWWLRVDGGWIVLWSIPRFLGLVLSRRQGPRDPTAGLESLWLSSFRCTCVVGRKFAHSAA